MTQIGLSHCHGFSCVLDSAPLHYISRQTMRDIHAYMHPQRCQRGCFITFFCHGFCLCAWMCPLHGRPCATFICTRTVHPQFLLSKLQNVSARSCLLDKGVSSWLQCCRCGRYSLLVLAGRPMFVGVVLAFSFLLLSKLRNVLCSKVASWAKE